MLAATYDRGLAKNIVRLLRPHQYLKNGFVFIGVLFAKRWDWLSLADASLAFAAFCVVASAVYVFNDLVDVEADRQHPTKRSRPLASGAVSMRTGWWLAGALTLSGLALAAYAGDTVLMLIAIYVALNVGYTLRWKHVVVLDVFIISSGFMLRILAGTIGIGIAPTSWLLLCGLMLTLFLGFSKRRAELLALECLGTRDKALSRRVLDDYSPIMIEQFMAISAACTVICYSLYTVSPETVAMHGTNYLIYTVPFVVYGIFRYLYLLHRHGKGNDTGRDVFADPHLLATVAGWIAITLAVLA